jgi:heme/copper-type cytochrome/quinol oxidase subunit 2
MDDAPASINVGLVGSLTMIFLVTAVTLLLVSFYRRYKRAAEKPDSEQQ